MQQEWLFIFILHFITYTYRQWNRTVYHGGDTDVPGLRRYRPDAVPVETRLLPASSRFFTVFDSLPGYSLWVPVVLNILKQPGTWAGLTRFNTVHPGSPRLSTVPPRLWHGSARFIPDHQTGVNWHLKPGQWERGYKQNSFQYHNNRGVRKMKLKSGHITSVQCIPFTNEWGNLC